MTKFLTIGLVIVIIILGSIIFLLRDTLLSEVTETVNPWGGCLEKFDILRNTGIASFSGGDRINESQLEILYQFHQDNCQYYVFRWMPEHYNERSYVEIAWYHEFRTDLTEEQKQKLRDVGAWPDNIISSIIQKGPSLDSSKETPTIQEFEIFLDPFISKQDEDYLFTYARVTVQNTGNRILNNVIVNFGSGDIQELGTLTPGQKMIISAPFDNPKKYVVITADEGIFVNKTYRIPSEISGMNEP